MVDGAIARERLGRGQPAVEAWAVGVDRQPATRIAFAIGAVLSITTSLWSVLRVPELPLTADERAAIARRPMSVAGILGEIGAAMRDMPRPMRQLAVAMLFQWYAMFCYWQYITFAVARSLFDTADPQSAGFREAALVNGQIGGAYNAVAFLSADLHRARDGAKPVHAACLALSGLAMLAIPTIGERAWLFVPIIGIGIGWASLMGNTYVMLADSIPAEWTGVYMGILKMFIVIPMLIQSVTMPLIYRPWLGGDPRNVLMLAGGLMITAAVATLFVRVGSPARTAAEQVPA